MWQIRVQKKYWIITSLILGIIISIILSYSAILALIGSFLVVQDELKKADAIIVINSDRNGTRVAQGVSLYKNGYADKLIFSGCQIAWQTNDADIMKKQALVLEVPEKAILLDRNGYTTFDNARNTLKIMKENHLNSAILVTSSYHTRRAMWIFKKVFKASGVKLSVLPARDSEFNPGDWWRREKDAKLVFNEYTKLIWYALKY